MSFVLVFPIFLLIVGILVQYALLLNARVWVEHAADVAARSAVTALPDDRPAAVEKAAILALVPLSPAACAPTSSASSARSPSAGTPPSPWW